jgi:hypothetical protein
MPSCHDCGGGLLPMQVKSKKYGVYLCRECFEKRTGWNEVKRVAGDPGVSDEEVKALAEK